MAQLNWDTKFAMEQAADDVDLFAELLEILKQACDADIRAIKAGLRVSSAKQVYRAAHSMKGAAASLGVAEIHELALAMELDARDGSLVMAEALYDRLEALIEELQKL